MYHSALLKYKQFDKKAKYYENDSITAFLFDVENDKIPDLFYSCDFIYIDLPYRKGYNIFNKRALKNGSGYEFFIFKILEILSIIKKPFFIIGEKNIPQLKVFLKCNLKYSIHNCNTYLYSNVENIKASCTDDLINNLFVKYNIGLDFLCGYGNTGKYAKKHNKKAILTDFNENCIGYIYENL